MTAADTLPKNAPKTATKKNAALSTVDNITLLPRFLLLSCCAPCACAVIQKLKADGADFAVAFYNPNIHPLAEYEKRRDEQKALCERWNIPFIELDYDPENWFTLTKGLEEAPERGPRCSLCFTHRLTKTMQYAAQNGFAAVASVLGVSRYKDLNQVNAAAAVASQKTGVPYLQIEGRKHGMQETRTRLIKELNLYSQNYCGCIYSLKNQLKK